MKIRPSSSSPEKHFLDSSAARPLLTASTKYRDYLKAQFRETPFISIYVQMEIRRSYIRAVVAFYSTLEMPSVLSVSDALSLFSNEFKSSRLRAVIQLIGGMMRTHSVNPLNGDDKSKLLTALASYIIRFESKLRRSFKDPGQDTTRCTRASIPLHFYADDLSRGLQEFAEKFDDTTFCRDNCSIDYVLLRRYAEPVKRYVEAAAFTVDTKETHGFIQIAENLKKIVEKGSEACSCYRCERIGDAVIALDAPRAMILEHVDRSFNQLCPPIGQPHRQHESEKAFHNSISAK